MSGTQIAVAIIVSIAVIGGVIGMALFKHRNVTAKVKTKHGSFDLDASTPTEQRPEARISGTKAKTGLESLNNAGGNAVIEKSETEGSARAVVQPREDRRPNG